MENNSYTNKEKALSLFKWSLKRNKAIIVAYTILMFVVFPMIEMISYVIYSSIGNRANFADDMKTAGPALAVVSLIALSLFFSTIITVIEFSYLHNKRKVDLFGSFPVSRRTLFFVRYASASTASIIPMIIIALIGGVFTLSSAGFGEVIRVLLYAILGVFGNVSMLAFISICCGTIVDVLVSYAIISGVSSILAVLICMFPKYVIPGCTTDNVNSFVYTLFTPAAAPFNTMYGTGRIYGVIWWIVLSVALTAACYKLCKERKAEVAQTAFAFRIVEYVIKAVTITTAGFGFGWVFSYLGYSFDDTHVKQEYIWFVTGVVIFTIVANLVLHLIYHRGLSGLKSSFKMCAVSTAVSLIFGFIIGSGMFGFDERVPATTNVQEIKIRSNNIREFHVNGENVMYSVLSDKDDIENVIKVHQLTVDGVVKKKTSGLYPLTGIKEAYDEDFDYVYGGYVIEYRLKNGKTMKRSYDSAYGKEIEMIYNYTSADSISIRNIPSKYITDISLANVKDYLSWDEYANAEVQRKDIKHNDKNSLMIEKMREALLKDIDNDRIYTYDEMNIIDDYSSINEMSYFLDINYENEYKEMGTVNYDSSYVSICIPKTYTNTIAVIEQYGLDK